LSGNGAHEALNQAVQGLNLTYLLQFCYYMKKLIFAISCLLVVSTTHAQFFSFGLKAGLNTQINHQNEITIGNIGNPNFNFGLDGRNFGAQFGVYTRFGNHFFVQPEVLFNSNKVDYKISETGVADVIKNEKYQYLDIPVLLGVKLGPVRIQTGPVGHYFLHSTSELTDYNGYKAKFKQLSWGWQGGLNVGFKRISLDFRYEGNFSKQGDHITFFGDQYHFGHSPERFIVGVNFAIVK
jgi:hypothetical protein